MGAVKKAIGVQAADMPRPPVDTIQVTFRIPSEWAIEADEVADLLSYPGKRASRTDALREAIRRGFEVLRAEGKVTGPKAVSTRSVKKKPV